MSPTIAPSDLRPAAVGGSLSSSPAETQVAQTSSPVDNNKNDDDNNEELSKLPAKKELTADKRFSHHFDEVKASLDDRINGLSDVAEVFGERSDAIDHCLAQVSELSREVKNASSYLPAHDQKRCTDAIKGLQDRVNEAKDRLSPRSKFSFKSGRKNGAAAASLDSLASDNLTTTTTTSTTTSTTTIDTTHRKPSSHRSPTTSATSTRKPSLTNPPNPPNPPSSSANNIIAQSQRDAYILRSTRSTPESGNLIKLAGCIVDLSGGTRPWQGLSAQDVSDSLLVCARVDGAAHLTGVRNSIVILAAQQVRMHECADVDVYLSCASQPIIEGCAGIRVAPIPPLLADKCFGFDNHDDDYGDGDGDGIGNGRLPPERDQWHSVLDFNWVRAGHSPNWSLLADTDVPKDIEWTYLTTDDLPAPVETVLRTFKIFKSPPPPPSRS